MKKIPLSELSFMKNFEERMMREGREEMKENEGESWSHKGIFDDLTSKDTGKIQNALQIFSEELTFATT